MATVTQYSGFVHSNGNKDPVLRALIDIEQALSKAWVNNRCTDCPTGELAALAAAARVFYEEQSNRTQR